jgi:hypothetical protein
MFGLALPVIARGVRLMWLGRLALKHTHGAQKMRAAKRSSSLQGHHVLQFPAPRHESLRHASELRAAGGEIVAVLQSGVFCLLCG